MRNPNTDKNSRGATPQSFAGGTPERDIDLYELMRGIAGRWRMIAGLVGSAVIIAMLVLVMTPPRYSSEVRILFGNTESQILNSDRQNSQPTINRDLVRSQVHVLRSRDLMMQVIKDLNLTKSPEFSSSNDQPGLMDRFLIWLGFETDTSLLSPAEKTWMTLAPRLVVFPLPESRVISVDMWSHDAKLAAAIANRLAQVYLNETREAKSISNKQATEWLAKRVQDLQKKVRKAETAVEKFRAQAGLLQGTTSTLNAQKLSGVESQIIVATANQSRAEARVRQIRKLLKNGGDITTSSEILQSPLIRRLREQQVTLRRLVADLSSKYLPSHPRMVRLRAEIQDLSRQVRSEMRKIVGSLQGQADVAAARVASLRANLDRIKVSAEQANSQRVHLKALQRDAKTSSQLLDTYLRRYREASARADIETQSPNARIISKAYVAATPSYPKKGPILVLLTLGALVLGVMIAFLMEIFTVKPIAKAPEIPDAVHFPKHKPVPERVIVPDRVAARFIESDRAVKAHNKTPPLTEDEQIPRTAEGNGNSPVQISVIAELPVISYQHPKQSEIEKILKGLIQDDKNYRQGIGSLQEFVTFRPPSERGTKVLALSNMHNFDKSMAVLSLARKLSAEDYSVLLIDTDFQIQNLSRSLNLMAFDGISDLITGSAQFTDVVIEDTHSGAHIISAGERIEFQEDDEVDVRLDAIVDAFAHAYDYVIVDGGMAYPGAPMWTLTPSSDCNIVFMSHTESEDVVADLVAQVYERAPASAIGVVSVENKSTIDILKSMKLFRQDAAA